jgi:hypothetical protein
LVSIRVDVPFFQRMHVDHRIRSTRPWRDIRRPPAANVSARPTISGSGASQNIRTVNRRAGRIGSEAGDATWPRSTKARWSSVMPIVSPALAV